VNVSVLEYVPVRSGSVALMGCLNEIAIGSLETAAAQVALENSTTSGYGNENVPFITWPGSDTVRAASPAVLMTLRQRLVAAAVLEVDEQPVEAGEPERLGRERKEGSEGRLARGQEVTKLWRSSSGHGRRQARRTRRW
jgi:hypothetical protein